MSGKQLAAGCLVVALAFGQAVSAFSAESMLRATGRGAPSSPVDLADWRTTISGVAKECGPSVAHIEVTDRKEIKGRSDQERSPESFFGRADAPRQFKGERKGLGSGMVLDTEGHVLTNAHVITGAARIEVTLANGERDEAKLVGIDSKTDLAVVRIPGRPSLRPVIFGDSDRLEVGEWVVAIGHPRGLDHTVTQGIVSAKHRRGITDPTSYDDFLQTDAAINPGNSGGPLLNLAGEVIGVNAMLSSASGGFEGIGFAIPSNMAVHIVRQLVANGKVERGWLGVTTEPFPPDAARQSGPGATKGALIGGVVEGGPAGNGGMRRGQLVVSFNGHPVEGDLDLRNRVAEVRPGTVVPVRVLEGGQTRDLSVTVGDLEAVSRGRLAAAESRLGISVREVTADETKLYRLKPSSGVVVTGVDPKGPATAQGLEIGDVIVEIQGQSIDNSEMFGMIAMLLPPGREASVLAVDHRTGEAGYLRLAPR